MRAPLCGVIFRLVIDCYHSFKKSVVTVLGGSSIATIVNGLANIAIIHDPDFIFAIVDSFVNQRIAVVSIIAVILCNAVDDLGRNFGIV